MAECTGSERVRVGRRGRGALVGAVLLAIGVVAGCAGQLEGDGPTATGDGATATGTAPGPGLTQDALLTAEQMPAWNGAMGWVEAVPPAGEGALESCDLPTAESLGAVEVLARDFEAAGIDDPGTTPDPTWPTPYGRNEVARFADTAAAQAGLAAWEDAIDTCAPAPDVPASDPPQSYRIATLPTGSTWAISVPEPDACLECLRFEFVGLATSGSVVTMVAFGLTGMDANYEDDPLADSMQASLDRLP